MMSQGRALKIPDRKKPARPSERQREKKTGPRKDENKAEAGLGKEQLKGQEGDTWQTEARHRF